TLIFTLILTVNFYAQLNEEKVVAKVGNDEITEDVFLERYELTPQANGAMIGAEESLKSEVLYSIIAEKLWAIEAEREGLSNSELMKTSYRTIEKMYVRDALYREEILDKVELTNNYLTEAFKRNSKILKLNYLFSTSEEEINNLYSLLKEGVSFDSLLSIRPESALQKKPYVVQYGQMDKEVEDSLYNLKIGNFTEPIKAPNGWYIFKLISTEEKVIENEEQADAEQKNVLKIARATIIDSLYKEYYSKSFANVDAKTNGELLLELSDKVLKILERKSKDESDSTGQKIFLDSQDLYKIESELGPKKLNEQFVVLDQQLLTLDDFIQELAFEKFFVDTVYADLIRGKLNLFVKRFIEHELFAREGYKRGYQNLPEVQRDLNMWKSYYLSDALRTKVANEIQVSDEEIRNYIDEQIKGETPTMEVKIIELLTNDLDVIKNVLDELDKGGDFKQLAKKFTIREEAKNNNGELGFFPVNQYGEIGRIAATLEIGQLYGPVQVPEGYSLFQLVDKKEENKLTGIDFEKDQARIKNIIKSKKYSDEIIQKTVDLANKYGVSVDEELLKSIKVLNTTTIVYRNFGFGGRLLAVPMTMPNYLWVKQWQEQQKLNP
ncbi:MAG: peptidylprolyl isomerase, partial [Ignavibacteriaceae bacterium]|nr:peptidylprolyl isomerase [Ignavibacteriaceae bacterium]